MDIEDLKPYDKQEIAELVTQLAKGQFGHLKINKYPTKFLRIDGYLITTEAKEQICDCRYYAELKLYLLEKSATYIELVLSMEYPNVNIKFRIPKKDGKFMILDTPVDIALPPINQWGTYSFAMNQTNPIHNDEEYLDRLVYPLAQMEKDRKNIINKYGLMEKYNKMKMSQEFLMEIKKVFEYYGHLVFDVCVDEPMLLPIRFLGVPKQIRYTDINIRIWIDNSPFYLI